MIVFSRFIRKPKPSNISAYSQMIYQFSQILRVIRKSSIYVIKRTPLSFNHAATSLITFVKYQDADFMRKGK